MWRTLTRRAFCVVALAASVASAAPHPAGDSYAIVGHIQGPSGITGWDHATLDSRSRRLFVAVYRADGGGVAALDLRTGRVSSILQIDGRPHGFAFLGRGLAAAAAAATHSVLFFREKTGKVIGSVDTGKSPQPDGWHNPDSLLLEPRTGLLIAVNFDSGELALVNVARRTVVGVIPIGRYLKSPVATGDGTVYVSIGSEPAIAVVDIITRKVVRKIPLTHCDVPTGLAYDAVDRLVISVCGDGIAKLIDPKTGTEVASLSVAKGADGVMYDPGRKLVFIAGGLRGWLSVVRIASRRDIAVVQTLRTQAGTRLGAVDPLTGTVYLPAAKPDLTAPPLRLPGLPPFPPFASGTFQFLVVAPQP